MDFAERLKELRKEKQMTQKQLAQYLGLTANSVCEWENRRSEPSIATLLKMGELFQEPVGYILGQTDELGNVIIGSENYFETSPLEQRLILDFRKLPAETQDNFAELFHNLAMGA